MTPLIVTDTSPLIAFERLGRLDLLPALYEVLAPEAVVREFGTHPPWLRLVHVEDSALRDELRAVLDEGEAEAIALAVERPGCALLLDESRGRRVAERFGLDVVGTLGVLVRAKRAGLVPAVRPLVAALREAHGFRVAAEVVASALREAGEA
jgi:predicted nucleic acid-binding protein